MNHFNYTGTRSFDLPKPFWNDHLERGCRCSDICPIRSEHLDDDGTEYARFHRVSLTAIDANELLSDADFYSTEWKYMSDGFSWAWLGSSAQATVRRLLA